MIGEQTDVEMFTSRGQVYPIVFHFWDLVPMIEQQRYTEMLVQHFPINPDTYGNVGKLLNNILIYGCSPIQGNISNCYPFHVHVFV